MGMNDRLSCGPGRGNSRRRLPYIHHYTDDLVRFSQLHRGAVRPLMRTDSQLQTIIDQEAWGGRADTAHRPQTKRRGARGGGSGAGKRWIRDALRVAEKSNWRLARGING